MLQGLGAPLGHSFEDLAVDTDAVDAQVDLLNMALQLTRPTHGEGAQLARVCLHLYVPLDVPQHVA